ncbi:MAG: Asp-tRNA(Asn)/Glu-tRNA(Gln) amidotransferase subunit GatA [Crocinitomicaceae bacterium]|nr:Asp-tRNA(Asn)/Glu-tRNA(Gln) amidotransferase subunit GatA [Crocinitomicaceae bacterium]MDG2505800.1 Asp-tRNA(Asn)/Glu-tRNA(Gln) amidotransferase subunit GatA [Crocinitomicaceae bacterium]
MYRTIADIKGAIQSGTSAISIVEESLSRIESKKELNAFVEVFSSSAITTAKSVDEKIKEGTAGKLAGVILGIKDNICFKGHKVSAASKILNNFESLFTATVLQKLLDEDAIVIGRLNCDEFAMGSTNETSYYGPVKNNINTNYVPGGSSGGSAVAVSAGMCTVSLGSDTGGSVRQPASWTNVFGLKPSYGRLSRYGLIAYGSSFDQIGIFANTIEDIKYVFDLSQGKDPLDSTSLSAPCISFENNKPLRVGFLTEYMNHDGLDKEIKKKVEVLQAELGKDIEVKDFSFPYLEHLVPTYYVLSTAEASSNLSRFDGVHYGHRSAESKGVDETYKNSRSEGFGKEVKRRIMTGTFVLSHGYYDAYYTKAQKVRRLAKIATDEIFKNVDVLITPTTASTAFKIGSVSDPLQMYLQDIFTVHANITGHPAISVPFGTHSNGMPFGLQIMSPCNEEAKLLYYAELLKNYF